ILPIVLALFKSGGEHGRKESCKRPALGHLAIFVRDEFVKLNSLAVVSPDLGYAERGIDAKFTDRFISDIDFDDDVRWRVFLQIKFSLTDHSKRICDVIAAVGLGASVQALSFPRCSTIVLDFYLPRLCESAHQHVNGCCVFLVLRQWTHDFQPSLIVADA